MDKNIDEISINAIDNFHKTIGANVKRLRESKGYSQLKLAELIGHKSVGLVSQAEIYHNKQHFNLTHLYKIAYVLECNIDDFFTGTVIKQ